MVLLGYLQSRSIPSALDPVSVSGPRRFVTGLGETGHFVKKWCLLGAAIAAEVTGTMLLRASIDAPGWSVGVVVSYLIAFAMLGLTLREGMAVGVAYGVWGAVGVALTALLGTVIFDETLSVTAIVGIGVIIVGVLVVHSGEAQGAVAEEPIDVAA